MIIKKRPDFLHAADHGRRIVKSGFVLQYVLSRRVFDPPVVRAGFTASKRVGNAVSRARAKRRLRPLCAEFMAKQGVAGYDYVLVARTAILDKPYEKIRRDMKDAFKQARQTILTPQPQRDKKADEQQNADAG